MMGKPKYLPRKLYYVWKSAKDRCLYKYGPYKYYGARGIKICTEWLNFYCFRDWALSNGYKEGLELDRKDTNGNYCPENCKWSTDKEQANNRRSNINVIIDGISHTLSEWADTYHINYNTVKSRLRKGWKAEDAIKIPADKKMRNKNIEEFMINGESHTLYDWCKIYGKGYTSVRIRLTNGKKLVDILGIENGQ